MSPNPAFMKNTRKAVKIVQAVSAPTFSSAGVIEEGTTVNYSLGRFGRVSERPEGGNVAERALASTAIVPGFETCLELETK
jgi:hypothetical protein